MRASADLAREEPLQILTTHVSAPEPFDWDGLVAFLGARAIPGVEAVEDGRWRRSLAIGSATGVVAVEREGSGQLRIEARLSDHAAFPEVVARVRRVFDLEANAAAIIGRLSADPELAPMLAARPGLRVPGAWDGFELAVRAILGQQVTVKGARTLAGRIVQTWGRQLPDLSDGEALMLAFPEPDQLADADLTAIGLPKARARALSGLATAAARDPKLFEPGESLEADVARLTRLPGVGVWTAQYIAMRALKRADAFPDADLGLLRALEGPDGVRPTPKALLARAEAWRPYRAYAALHLWAADSARRQIT